MSGRMIYKWRSSRLLIGACAFVGIFNDIVSYSLPIPFLPTRLEQIGIPEQELGAMAGYLVAGYAFGCIISSPIAAWMGSSFNRHKRAMILGFISALALATLLFMLAHTFSMLLIARILQGISSTGSWTFLLALVSDSVPAEQVSSTLGFVMIGLSAGNVCGPVIGGILFESFGYRTPFYFLFALVALDFSLRFLIFDKSSVSTQEDSKSDATFTKSELLECEEFQVEHKLEYKSDSAQYSVTTLTDSSDESHIRLEKVLARAQPIKFLQQLKLLLNGRILTLFVLSILNGVYVGCFLDTALVFFLQDVYGLKVDKIGLIFLAAVIPSFFVSPLTGWFIAKYSAKLPVFLTLSSSIPLFLLCLVKLPLWALIVILFLLGPTLIGFSTALLADLAEGAKDIGVESSLVFAGFQMFYFTGTFIGPIAGGNLISILGIQKGWMAINIINAALTGCCLIPSYIFVGGRGTSWFPSKPIDIENSLK